MSNQLHFHDEARRALNNDIQPGMDAMVPKQQGGSRKRKRPSADQQAEELGSKRSERSAINGGDDHLHGSSVESFSDHSNDYPAFPQRMHHVAASANDPSSTAAAALAAQLNVSEPPNMSFVSTGSGPDGDRQIDTSFDLGGDGGPNLNAQSSPYHLAPFTSMGGTAAQVHAAREASNGGALKPAVGTDEWHKVRRDNHKEGQQVYASRFHFYTNVDAPQLSVVAEKPSMKGSMSWPRSFRPRRRIKAPSCKVRLFTLET